MVVIPPESGAVQLCDAASPSVFSAQKTPFGLSLLHFLVHFVDQLPHEPDLESRSDLRPISQLRPGTELPPTLPIVILLGLTNYHLNLTWNQGLT